MTYRICVDCGGKVILSYCGKQYCQEQRQQRTKDAANRIFKELKETSEEFGKKTKDENLDVNDVKEYLKLKTEISEFAKIKGTDNWNNYWMFKPDCDLMKNHISNLEKTVKEYASPQTQDKAKGLKERKTKCEKHDKGIEPCTDNPNWFNCSYCWEQESPEFLKTLQRWHLDNFSALLRKTGKHWSEFINNPIYKKLSDGVFTSQKEVNNTYQELLVKANIDDKDQQRERERERERAKLRKKIRELEKKPNRTPEEETELENLRNKLKDLNEPDNKKKQSSSPTSYTPWIISGGCLVIFLIFVVIIFKKSKKK